MRVKCEVCGTVFSQRKNNHSELITNVCSGECLFRLGIDGSCQDTKTFRMDFPEFHWVSDYPVDFKSDLEERFWAWLQGQKIPVLYEPFAVALDDNRHYLPDFLLFTRTGPIVVETKGLWLNHSPRKCLEFKEKYGHKLSYVVLDDAGVRRMMKWIKK